MGEKTYVIDDRVVIKDKYLKMSREERKKAIQEIISEDTARRQKIQSEYKKDVKKGYTGVDMR